MLTRLNRQVQAVDELPQPALQVGICGCQSLIFRFQLDQSVTQGGQVAAPQLPVAIRVHQ